MYLRAARSIRLEFHKSFLLPLGALLFITIFRFGVARGLLSTGLFFACLMAHELGHAMFAVATQTKVSGLGFSKWGAYIRRHKAQDPAHELLIAAAGPLVNLVIALALREQSGIVQWLAQLNGVLFVVNILPFWNSDGKRILNTMRELRSQPAKAPAPQA
jgi:Zn-dependent protease